MTDTTFVGGAAIAPTYSEKDNLGQSKELHEYGMAKGHPPIADKLILIDFDGTIVPWGPLMGEKVAFPGVPESIRNLKALGYRIGIFTSRMSDSWLLAAFGKAKLASKEQYEYVASTLIRNNIPFDFITAEKVPAEVYFDDKAIGVRLDFPLDQAIEKFLNEGLA